MQWFYNLKISAKLLLSFAVVLTLTALLGVFSVLQLREVNATATEMEVNWMPAINHSSDMKANIGEFRMVEMLHILAETEDGIKLFDKELSRISDELAESRKNYEALISGPEEKLLNQDFSMAWTSYMEESNRILRMSREMNKIEARSLINAEAYKRYSASVKVLDKIVALNIAGGKAASKRGDVIYARSLVAVFVFLAVVIALGIGIAVFIARAISRPIAHAVEIAQTVARGDLTGSIKVSSKDETGKLLQALKEMNESLVRIVSEVRSGTETMATASSQIASGNLDLSARTEEQASSLEETAASMEELTSTVRQNAENALQANQLASSASDTAVKGGNVVGEVVSTMAEINASSSKIVDIISVIDGIAFQTNILALNAAVEAARAGEQGRGFAVVAAEVRTLAQRSASAAKEIKELIDNSVEKVAVGTRLVSEAGTTMDEIVGSVKRVTDIMAEIRAAGQEQSAGIEQVNQAIGQMDQVTQQNAALVEEAASAADSLQQQAANLAQVVSVFKLDQQAHMSPSPAPRAAVMKKPVAVRAVTAQAGSAPTKLQPPRRMAPAVSDGWEEF